jgi:hypothetical protein
VPTMHPPAGIHVKPRPSAVQKVSRAAELLQAGCGRKKPGAVAFDAVEVKEVIPGLSRGNDPVAQ